MKIRIFIFLLLLILTGGCSREPEIKNIDSTGKNIICFGNSLTFGTGAKRSNSYPAILGRRLDIPVINAGVKGDKSKDGLMRIEEDVLNKEPLMVIIEFGGNDYLASVDKNETLKNIEKMVDLIQDKGAMVVLLEVKAGIWSDTYLKGFKKIAKEKKALLIPDILGGIMFKSEYMSDYIHPNDKGYKIMAERILREIEPLLRLNKERRDKLNK